MSIQSLTLRFTNPTQQVIGTQEISSTSNGQKSVPITDAGILAAFNANTAGTIFTPSMIANYGNDESGNPIISVTSPASNIPSFIPRVISLASVINKTINDVPFNLSSLITTISAGALSYSSSNPSVASVNSSGQVTLLTEGTTTITINVTATAEHMAGSTSTTLNVTTPPRWRQLGADIDGINFEEQSGSSVSLSSNGRTLAIGAPNINGRTHIFDLNTNVTPNQWTQRGLSIYGEIYDGKSGRSVSISSDGNIVAIGSVDLVCVFYWNTAVTPNAWTQRGSVSGNGNFGLSVSLSSDGNILAVGVPDADTFGENNGNTRIFYWNTAVTPNAWTQRGSDIDGVLGGLGWAVSISSDGNTIASGSKFLGQAVVYDWNTAVTPNAWTQRGSNIGIVAYTTLGQLASISLSSNGNTLAIGNPRNNGGFVMVYDWNTTLFEWVKRGQTLDRYTIGTPPYYDNAGNIGYSISLSYDGNMIAIGAPESVSNKGIVIVYYWNTTISPNTWTQRGLMMTGEAADDVSGRAVSLSSDGSIVAIGAPSNTGAGWKKGHTRVYNYY